MINIWVGIRNRTTQIFEAVGPNSTWIMSDQEPVQHNRRKRFGSSDREVLLSPRRYLRDLPPPDILADDFNNNYCVVDVTINENDSFSIVSIFYSLRQFIARWFFCCVYNKIPRRYALHRYSSETSEFEEQPSCQIHVVSDNSNCVSENRPRGVTKSESEIITDIDNHRRILSSGQSKRWIDENFKCALTSPVHLPSNAVDENTVVIITPPPCFADRHVVLHDSPSVTFAETDVPRSYKTQLTISAESTTLPFRIMSYMSPQSDITNLSANTFERTIGITTINIQGESNYRAILPEMKSQDLVETPITASGKHSFTNYF